MSIQLTTDAVEDLETGAAFYETIKRGLGSYFTNCLFTDIDSLLLYAGIHPTIDGWYFMNSHRFPFVIWYGIAQGDVIVYAILDGRTEPETNAAKLRSRRG